MGNERGFTLIELAIVVGIIGILAAIALPQLGNAIVKSHEAVTKGNLGTIRSALAIYYADTEGTLPTDNLTSLTLNSKYLRAIPLKYTPPYHPQGNSVGTGATYVNVTEDWFYFNVQGFNQFGNVLVNCVHSDLKGTQWSTY